MPCLLCSLPHSLATLELLFQHAQREERLMRPHSQLKSSCQLMVMGKAESSHHPHCGPQKGTLLPHILTQHYLDSASLFLNGHECKGGTRKRKRGERQGDYRAKTHYKQWMKLSKIKETLNLNQVLEKLGQLRKRNLFLLVVALGWPHSRIPSSKGRPEELSVTQVRYMVRNQRERARLTLRGLCID